VIRRKTNGILSGNIGLMTTYHEIFNINVLTDIIDTYSHEYVLKPYFKEYLHRINWVILSTNPNAVDFLKENLLGVFKY
jgi:hypothetical protein